MGKRNVHENIIMENLKGEDMEIIKHLYLKFNLKCCRGVYITDSVIVFLCCQLRGRLLGTIALACIAILTKRSPFIALAVGYIMSKICE